MIAAWMLYSALWAVWSAAAAWVIERVLLRGRAAVRGVWIGAMALSIAGPLLGYEFAHRTTPAPVAVVAGVQNMRVSAVMPVTSVHSTPPAIVERAATTLRGLAARSDGPLAAIWLLLSLGVVVYVAGGLIHLHSLRRRWRKGVVDGVDVMISDDTGPALVGVIRSTIVVPEWALDLQPPALSLLMRHELEHRHAGDARLLALAQVVVAAVPWNPLLWWQLRRLRLAVELDCDARVLRAAPDIRSYGQLLLEVGRPHREFRVAGAALADHAKHLERRILAMSLGRRGDKKRAFGVSVVAGALAVAIGCQMPAPSRPADPSTSMRPANATSAARDSSSVEPSRSSTNSASQRRDSAAAKRRRDDLALSSSGQARLSDSGRYAAMAKLIEKLRDAADDVRHGDSTFASPDRRRQDSIAIEKLQQLSACASAPAACSWPSDEEAAEQATAGCSASSGPADSVIVKFLISDSDARRGGKVAVTSARSRFRGAQVGYTEQDMTCSTRDSGLLRLYGAGAIADRKVVVNWGAPTVIILTTGDGRVLVGPVALTPQSGEFELSWRAK